MPKEIMGIITYSSNETAEMLGVTRRTLSNYLKAGKIVGSMIAGQRVFTEKQIKEFITEGSTIDNRPGSMAQIFNRKK